VLRRSCHLGAYQLSVLACANGRRRWEHTSFSRISPFRDHEHRLTSNWERFLWDGGAHPGSGVPPSRSRRGSPSVPGDDPGQYETVDTESPVVGPHRAVLGDQGLVERPPSQGGPTSPRHRVEADTVVTRHSSWNLGILLGLPEDGVAPRRLQRTAGHCLPSSSVTVVHSQVARPSGPPEAPVISDTHWSVWHRLHPQAGGHSEGPSSRCEALTGIIERPDGGPEHLALVVVQATVVSLERLWSARTSRIEIVEQLVHIMAIAHAGAGASSANRSSRPGCAGAPTEGTDERVHASSCFLGGIIQATLPGWARFRHHTWAQVAFGWRRSNRQTSDGTLPPSVGRAARSETARPGTRRHCGSLITIWTPSRQASRQRRAWRQS